MAVLECLLVDIGLNLYLPGRIKRVTDMEGT